MREYEMKMIEQIRKDFVSPCLDPKESCERKDCQHCHAQALYNANYRKVGDDEVIVKKGMLIDAAKAFEELGNLYANGFVTLAKHHETIKQVAKETASEILFTIYTYLKGAMTQQTTALMIVKALAEHYGIEMGEVE
jgi:hypothetical protein